MTVRMSHFTLLLLTCGTVATTWHPYKDYQCAGTDYSIPGYFVCDGYKDCPEADDEVGWRKCGWENFGQRRQGEQQHGTQTPPTTTSGPTTTFESTPPRKNQLISTSPRRNLVKCHWSSKEVPLEKICDKIWDCPFGDDEDGCRYETTPHPTTTTLHDNSGYQYND